VRLGKPVQKRLSRHAETRRLYSLSLAALGIVFGDIGTSPLYAMRACFNGPYGVEVNPENILGVLSIIIWSLILVVSVKYVAVVMKADNRGEGGILSLMALLVSQRNKDPRSVTALFALGIFGAALLFGDGMITPAISVLSAVEGLAVVTPIFAPYTLPLSLAILFGLFAIQKRGTASIGAAFGPVMVVWFVVLSTLGLYRILGAVTVLAAFNPYFAVRFFLTNHLQGFLVLGAVFLVVTGAEMLYADIGHFGKPPVRLAWFTLVFPALLLNYLGQGALLIRNPAAAANPFYHLVPPWGLFPLVALATAATVVASQAVISGVFSLTQQAIQLEYSPRMEIRHSSPLEIGQVYIPWMNWILFIATMLLVLFFRSSNDLAAAYGVAVSATMAITTILTFRCARDCWSWPLTPVLLIFGLFFIVDCTFLGFSLLKVRQGGWIPLVIAILAYGLMDSWNHGITKLLKSVSSQSTSVAVFFQDLLDHPPVRVPGTAVYLGGLEDLIPQTLLNNIKHNKIVHHWVLLIQVKTIRIPRVGKSERATIEVVGRGLVRIVARYGFMESPNIPRLLKQISIPGWEHKPMETTFFMGRETLIVKTKGDLRRWRLKVFSFLHKNVHQSSSYYHLPPNRVVELGTQIEI